jgi:phosphoserine phosphatase
VAFGDGKYHVTKEWADANDVDLMQCHFYTDSMSDVLLMEKVRAVFPRLYILNPDPQTLNPVP